MSRQRFYRRGSRWQNLARRIRKRDGYRCRKCGRAGRLEVDHIVRVVDGGAIWDPDNLQTLCRRCHIDKSRSEHMATLTPSEWAWRASVDQLRNDNDNI